MDHVHIHRQGNQIHHQLIQTLQPTDCIPHKQYITQPLLFQHTPSDKFTQSGACKLTCPDGGKAYIGQTGRDFTSRYNEHKRSFRNNTSTSKFAKHLNDHLHSFGPIKDVIQVVQLHKKGPHLNTIERFHIHKAAAPHNHLSDEGTINPNRLFDTILNITP